MPRSTRLFFLLLALAALCPPSPALAHKVNVFAYVDGQNLVMDCFFSKSDKVRQGAVSILDAATGEVLATGTTDDKGALSLPVPPKAVATGHDLKIVLKAGEGHQSDTVVLASEFAALKPKTAAAVKPEVKPLGKKAAAAASATAASAPAAGIDEATLTRLVTQAVDQAVESRLAPVKRLLMEAAAPKGPSFVEIAGGIGYIFGLFGIAALVASKRKDKSGK